MAGPVALTTVHIQGAVGSACFVKLPCAHGDPDKVLVGARWGASLRQPCILREECHRAVSSLGRAGSSRSLFLVSARQWFPLSCQPAASLLEAGDSFPLRT